MPVATYQELDSLPTLRQAEILLRRLAHLNPSSQNTFAPYNYERESETLAHGFPRAEARLVTELFLGAPMRWLENEGLIRRMGNEFYAITKKGYEAAKEPKSSFFEDKDHSPVKPGGVSRTKTIVSQTPSPRTAIVINCLIASPSDVGKERDVVSEVIEVWNAAHFNMTGVILRAIRWETHSFPESGDRPQAIVNRQMVDEGDFLIGIFGTRLGTPTGSAQSGTIEEIERFRKAGKHIALYFSKAPVPRGVNRDELEALEKYQRERQKDTLYSEFENAEQLKDHLTQHLPRIVAKVQKHLNESHQLEGLEEEVRETRRDSEKRLQFLVNGEPVGQYKTPPDMRIAQVFDETKPLVPEYLDGVPTNAYQTWFIRPHQSLHLRLDKAFADRVQQLMETSFSSPVPGNFLPLAQKGSMHRARWIARLSNGNAYLTYARRLEITEEGAFRYCEKIDRHDNLEESVSDLFVTGLQFFKLLSQFFDEHKYAGPSSALHRVDCLKDVRFLRTFPNEHGQYYESDAILFPDVGMYGIGTGFSRIGKEIISFRTPDEREEKISDFMLAHMRELCGATVDYHKLREVVKGLPERASIPPY